MLIVLGFVLVSLLGGVVAWLVQGGRGGKRDLLVPPVPRTTPRTTPGPRDPHPIASVPGTDDDIVTDLDTGLATQAEIDEPRVSPSLSGSQDDDPGVETGNEAAIKTGTADERGFLDRHFGDDDQPADAPATHAGSTRPPNGGESPGPSFVIKGNAQSMIYHTPASTSYERTIAGVWFETEEAAVAAGFRPPKTRQAKTRSGS